ncbi:MAG: IS21-like element helper ATPase IstB [Bacillota bacterium]|nr:IS21-like element helper ATPase IstB [Bacillota bacterium]
MDTSLQTLRKQLMELKLKHLAEHLGNFMLEASCSDKPYAQFMQEFLSLEIRHRRTMSMDKRLRYANFPSFDKPLDLNSYDFAKRPGVTKRQIIELTSNFLWIDKAYNVLFLGGSGLGKSFLSCYIGYKAIEVGYNVIFVSMNTLAHLLKTESVLSRSKTKMKRIRNCDLLILDEVANTVLDRQEGNLLFQLVSDFYQQASLIVTSNKGFEDWAKVLGDNVVTAAIMDRLLHKCEIFNLGGDSWRMEDQQSILRNLLKGGAHHG